MKESFLLKKKERCENKYWEGEKIDQWQWKFVCVCVCASFLGEGWGGWDVDWHHLFVSFSIFKYRRNYWRSKRSIMSWYTIIFQRRFYVCKEIDEKVSCAFEFLTHEIFNNAINRTYSWLIILLLGGSWHTWLKLIGPFKRLKIRRQW